MPPAGFEPAVPACEQLQNHVLDYMATGIGFVFLYTKNYNVAAVSDDCLSGNKKCFYLLSSSCYSALCLLFLYPDCSALYSILLLQYAHAAKSHTYTFIHVQAYVRCIAVDITYSCTKQDLSHLTHAHKNVF